MRPASKLLSYGLLAILIISVSGCKKKGGPGPTAEEVQFGKLAKSWTATEVLLGTQVMTDYSSFVLTITGTFGNDTYNYNASGRPDKSPWPASGTWVFGSDPETQIIRDTGVDELAMGYSVTDTQLVLTFDFVGDGYDVARTANVEGNWTFTFTVAP